MTTDVIDTSFHGSAFPAGSLYTGPGTVVGNALTSGGAGQWASVYFTSDGNATNVLLGFRPVHVKVVNVTDSISWEWLRGMPVADSVKTTFSSPTIAIDTGSAINPTEGNGATSIAATSSGGNWYLALSATLCGTSKAINLMCYG